MFQDLREKEGENSDFGGGGGQLTYNLLAGYVNDKYFFFV